MHDNPTLRRAVARDPFDLAGRSAYVDWLKEFGGPDAGLWADQVFNLADAPALVLPIRVFRDLARRDLFELGPRLRVVTLPDAEAAFDVSELPAADGITYTARLTARCAQREVLAMILGDVPRRPWSGDDTILTWTYASPASTRETVARFVGDAVWALRDPLEVLQLRAALPARDFLLADLPDLQLTVRIRPPGT